MAARWRLLGHFMAALVSLFLLTGVPPFKLLGYQWDLGWVGVVLFAFYLVWLLNLYNFMDGIDGSQVWKLSLSAWEERWCIG